MGTAGAATITASRARFGAVSIVGFLLLGALFLM
jgi:hypothetical protein